MNSWPPSLHIFVENIIQFSESSLIIQYALCKINKCRERKQKKEDRLRDIWKRSYYIKVVKQMTIWLYIGEKRKIDLCSRFIWVQVRCLWCMEKWSCFHDISIFIVSKNLKVCVCVCRMQFNTLLNVDFDRQLLNKLFDVNVSYLFEMISLIFIIFFFQNFSKSDKSSMWRVNKVWERERKNEKRVTPKRNKIEVPS